MSNRRGDVVFVQAEAAPPVSEPFVPSFGGSAPVAEVRVSWGDSRLCVEQIQRGAAFTLGSAVGVKGERVFVVPAGVLGKERWELIRSHSGAQVVCLPEAGNGSLEQPGAERMDLGLARAGLERCDGGHVVELHLGTKLSLELGALTFEIECVRPLPRPARAVLGDARSIAGYWGASMLSVGGLLGMMAYFVPPMGINDGHDTDLERVYLLQQYLETNAEPEREPEPEDASTEEQAGGVTGAAAAGESGALGKPEAQPSKARVAVKGPADNPNPELPRLSEIESFGMVGLLASGVATQGPASPFARDTALGADPMNAFGNMWGDEIGDTQGSGLGLLGIGEGGGSRYAGIGLGEVGTIGTLGSCSSPDRAQCIGLGHGFGTSHGRVGGAHKVKSPKVRMSQPTVSGRLPPQAIQRIVRQNFGRFRQCYEKGLSSNPNLEGRVAVRFMIDRDGRVASADNGGSSIPNSEVVQCVVRAFYGLSFPSPENGSVKVVYPIMFSPD